MDIQAILAGVGTILTGAGGTAIVIHEFRKRDRKELTETIDQMSDELHVVRADLLSCRRYAFDIMDKLGAEGVEVPPIPELHKVSEREHPPP